MLKKYFSWLQKDAPIGEVERLPQQNHLGETSLYNVFVIGDLTGIPLLKIAIEETRKRLRQIIRRSNFQHDQKKFSKELQKENTYEIVIIGAGPAGISAAITAQKKGLSYIVLESAETTFATLRNFPKGKHMFYEPKSIEQESPLALSGNTKEELLENLDKKIHTLQINIQTGTNVEKISSIRGGLQTITTNRGSFRGLRTFLAIGKSGNARQLGIAGEQSEKVFNRLIDPSEFSGKKILIVGGGDSALETALALAEKNDVTISYRKSALCRAKTGNINAIHALAEKKEITLLMNTNVAEIKKKEVIFAEGQHIQNDIVFVMIGKELPYTFFKKCGIEIENTWSTMTKWWLVFSLSFANIIYFGKASHPLPDGTNLVHRMGNILSGNFSDILLYIFSWGSILTLCISSIVVSIDLIKNFRLYFRTKWHLLKYGYFAFAIMLFLWAFFGSKYLGNDLRIFDQFHFFGMTGIGGSPYFWYAFLYTLTITFFGIRRIVTSKTKYVTRQTITLILIQAFPLFFIPEFILPWMDTLHMIPETIKETVFLGGEWWRFVGFILAWPLFIWNVFTDEPSMFWLIVSLIQTFIIIPWLVIKYGKGAYCGWICSCGAMAETLGDEYRHLAPHGPKWKKLELAGQWVLFAIILVTALHALSWFSVPDMIKEISTQATMIYKIIVDIFLAGTLGVGVYFFYSGRFWCRMFCPLAALMHIYQKFGQYRIFADKQKCISCGICTKVCHMGIDVMSYAQKGKPMDDVECVRCSACIRECPMGVLSFGRYKKLWGGDSKVIGDKVNARKEEE